MAGNDTIETAGGIAVLELPGGSAAMARLVWADGLFLAEYEKAELGAAAFDADVPPAFLRTLERLQVGQSATVECTGGGLFGRGLDGVFALAGLGERRVLIALTTQASADGQGSDSRLAETLDAVPVAAAVVDAADGTIYWINEAFRELLDGSDFDLMGTTLSDHLALPGAFKTLMAATGPVAPSAPVPTPLKTLSGMLTPVAATAKRVEFRGRAAALVCLARGY
jgi:PAS domain-containing protein